MKVIALNVSIIFSTGRHCRLKSQKKTFPAVMKIVYKAM